MSTLNEARQPSLKDKLAAQEKALIKEEVAVEVELEAVKKAKKRAGKKN
jgi:hypothetical protein